jgi:hypothetical protein
VKVKHEHTNISNSTETKFLGLIIDETLSWNQHFNQIATKVCSACYVLRNLKHTVPQSTLRKIYYTYIHSILSYGIIFGGSSSSVNKLQIKHPTRCNNQSQNLSFSLIDAASMQLSNKFYNRLLHLVGCFI